MSRFIKRWGHGLLGLYILIYLPIFNYLEVYVINYHSIHSPIDDYIPFNEYFIIPYFFWFIFIAIACVYFFFHSQGESIRFFMFLILGMSTALFIYYIYPNGLVDFRPTVFPRDNICTHMVAFLYSIDTSTNVLPSLHVYNTVAVIIAICKSKTFGRYHKLIIIISSIIGIFICLSTLFLKQHSILDLFAALIMAVFMYFIVYKTKLFNKFQ